jgi:Ca2+-transporting ATPase
VLINAVLGVVQENKAEKAIEALQEIAAATSRVVRGGMIQTIHSQDLVPGDVIVLEAGDAVPADARILESASLKIEEAALTGESVPVSKICEALSLGGAKDVPLGDRRNMVYMGSTVVYGRGRAVVVQTGMNTEMGKIADALSQAKDNETPLQRKLNQLSKILSFLVIGICLIVFAIDIFRAYPNVSGEGLLDTFMIAVSLAVAAIPEGLAAVVTIVLSIGVTNMSARNAVIRKLTAVETLGCTQIICSDKTGTLTQNKMTVVDASTTDETLLATAMSLCSDAEPGQDGQAVGEPTECALVNYAAALGLDKGALKTRYPRVGEAPFDSMRKMMSTVHASPDGGFVQFTKGAPDVVLDRSTTILENGAPTALTPQKRHEILAANKAMADKALRVLCAAMRTYDAAPQDYEPQALETDLCYIGPYRYDRPGAARSEGGHRAVPAGRCASGDDHRRPSGYCGGHCHGIGHHHRPQPGHHRRAAGRIFRSAAFGAYRGFQRLCPRAARAQGADRQSLAAEGQDYGHDRRRRQRRALDQKRRYRRGDGHYRYGRDQKCCGYGFGGR